jgi:sugar (pentulose or hexulose) kinase
VGGASLSSAVHVSTGETSGKAIASLVLGIGGFVIFPLVLSILAIVFGRSAKREIAERPGLGGAGLATAGIVLGWIGVGFIGLAVVVAIAANA